MLVEMSYSEYAGSFSYGSNMIESLTSEAIDELDKFFDELGLIVDSSHRLNPDNFWINVSTVLCKEDLEEYGFTTEQIEIDVCDSAKESLKAVNPEAYKKLTRKHTVFGWTEDEELFVL